MPTSKIEAGDVVEFFVSGHGPRLGNVENIPKRRVVARISHKSTNAGGWVAYDPDGVRVMAPDDATVIVRANEVRAGWGSL